MKKRILLLCGVFFSVLTCIGAPTILHDFENGTAIGGWDMTEEIVDNPLSNTTNGSSKCNKVTYVETWGKVAAYQSFDPTANAVTLLVYADNLGEVIISVAGDNDTYPVVTQAILAEKQWVRIYFDFSALTSTAGSILIGTGSKNTIYIDDIGTIPLAEVPSGACAGEMDVEYSYGSVAIGGGGFVSGLIAHPAEKDLKYARTDVGGAYKWNAADCSWKPLNNFISAADKGLLSVEALALDPNNTQNIYMLGGSMYFSGAKTAIMYSKDGGESFTTVDVSHLLKVHGNGNGRGNGERLAVDPHNGNILFCGGRVGSPLISSTDGGETWSEVATFPSSVYTESVKWPSWTTNMEASTPNTNGISAVVFDPSSVSDGKTQRIFVGVSVTGSSNIYVSEDAGASWDAITSLPTNWMPLRMKMDPDGNLLIAYSDKEGPNNCGTNGGIYRYDPNTKTAENISPPGNHPIGDISCSPTSADSLVCTTICTWVPQKWNTGNSVNGDIIFTSTDGGKNWRSLQDNFQFDANGCTWIPDHAIHWSCSILMDPYDHNKVSVTSGNGIFTTNNVWCDAAGGPTFYFDVNGLEETVPLDVVSVPGGDLYSAIGDYTGFQHSDIHAFPPIHKPESHTTGGIAYAAKNTDIMARVAHASYYTENGGETWSEMAGAPTVNDASYSKVAISADGTTILYLPAGTGIPVYSTNKGATFASSTNITGAGYVAADPVNANYFYAGAEDAVYVSSDNGKSFAKTNINNGEYTRLCVVPEHEGLVYVPKGGNGLAVSSDYGQSFATVPFVTNCEAVGVGVGKTLGSYVLYIHGKANGCDVGLYRSEDEGASWQRINDETTQFGGVGNGAFIVGDQNEFGRFYMATVGLGIVYGEPSATAAAPQWNCFVDNTACKVDNGPDLKTQSIVLASGWNLLSFNVHPEDSTIETLFDGLAIEEVKDMDSFWKYDQAAHFNSLNVLQAGNGYLVRMANSGTLTVTGLPMESKAFTIKEGWNLIGCPYQTSTLFSNDFNDTNTQSIKNFDGYWKPDGLQYSIDSLLPGKAYFLSKP